MKISLRWCHAATLLLPLAAAAVACSAKEELPAAGRPAGRGADRGAGASSAAGGEPVAVTILYGSEKKTWLEQELLAFNASGQATRSGRPILASGKAMGSGEAMAAILDGTERPHVFSPASGAYVTLLNQAWQSRDGHTRPLAPAGEPLVLSPVVIAMWKPMAEALGWPGRPLGWADILAVGRDPRGWERLGRPEWGALKLGHTQPEQSSSGLLSVLAIAYAGAHATRGLAAADVPRIEPFLAGVEDAIVHYGKSTGFFADKMIERGPDYLSAAVLYENLVIESYARAPAMPLVAIYPVEGTFWAEHPFSVLDGDWVSAEEREAAAALLAFLRARPAQEQALALGFRPVDPAIPIGAPIDLAHGVDPKQPQTLLEIPDAGALDALLAAWRRTKKAADVVLVFDKSGSMAGRPLEEAKRGAKEFLTALDARDQVTLVCFDGRVYRPYGPVAVGGARVELAARIDGISAGGETAVYDATHEAYALLEARRRASSHRIRAVVVMTDGTDNRSARTLDDLRAELRGEDRAAAVFTIAYGAAPSRDALAALAADGGGSFAEGDVGSIIQIYRDLATFF
jgi:Ca-activated chloride channel family protein